MSYDSPGRADSLSTELSEAWNETILRAYNDLAAFHSRFFTVDPSSVPSEQPAPAVWFGDPAEPGFCLDEEWARKLSDWGVRGRHQLHNEYCEYTVSYGSDSAGRRRPKRVHVTTELREYWVALATKSPTYMKERAAEILGYEPSWEDLYGVADPVALGEPGRRKQFCITCAGHGNDNDLANRGVPAQPRGPLNRANALFMSHPINGLDDLFYIVMFGARPYARQGPTGRVPATKEQIFRASNVTQLACRHADPAAATAAHRQAFAGKQIAFANPLGVYIANFSSSVFQYESAAVPDSWVRYSRGDAQGLYQHLEFGPPDDVEVFLDDIHVVEGADSFPLTGGYHVAQRVEVGPLLVIGPESTVADEEYVDLSESTGAIDCAEAEVCTRIRRLRDAYDQSDEFVRVGPRTMGPGWA